MASEMLKKTLANNKKLEIISAGTSAMLGMKATENTLNVLQKEGINAFAHKSAPVTKDLIDKADLIFVMERFHKDRILEISPEVKPKVHLLREFQKDPHEVVEPEVPDPIGKPMEVYERSFELIKEGLENLVKWLKENGWA
jgi:protein-tyrosine-phosphatase